MDIREKLKLDEKNKPTIKFLITFVGLLVLFNLTYKMLPNNIPFYGTHAVAKNLNFWLNSLGMLTICSGDIVTLPKNGAFRIITDCTGVYEVMVFTAAVVAYSAVRWKTKLWGLAMGVAILYILNLLRLVVLAYIKVNYPSQMDFVHLYLWPTSLILFISFTFLVWLEIADRYESKGYINPRLIFVISFFPLAFVLSFIIFKFNEQYSMLTELAIQLLALPVGLVSYDAKINFIKYSFEYPNLIQFSIVPFLALVAAMPRMTLKRKLQVMLIGTFLFFPVQFLLTILLLLLPAFQSFLADVSAIGRFAMPVILWLGLCQKEIRAWNRKD